jgi:hypothetical protein
MIILKTSQRVRRITFHQVERKSKYCWVGQTQVFSSFGNAGHLNKQKFPEGQGMFIAADLALLEHGVEN